MQSVALRRQFKDGYEPIATAVKHSEDEIDVVVFPGNVTYRTVERRYEMLLSVTFDPFDCLELTNFSCGLLTDEDSASKTAKITSKIFAFQSELPRPIPRNSVESDHGCTSGIYFDNAGDAVTLTLYNVTLTSQKPC